MKAYIETNVSKGVQILTQAKYDDETVLSADVLYLIVADDSSTALSETITILKAYIGKTEQAIVTDNSGDIIYRLAEVNGSNATVDLAKLV